MTEINGFKELGLSPATLEALSVLGFTQPTPVQREVIPLILNDISDIIGSAQTGTGKTAAFGLPILDRIDPSIRGTQALILTPTRELALQVTEALKTFRGKREIGIVPIFGGSGYAEQFQALRKEPAIVVGTPGRVIDHLERRTLDISKIRFFVLDEADEMLNAGFYEDIEHIFQGAGTERRTLLFSATMPIEIERLALRFMNNPTRIAIGRHSAMVDTTEQQYIEVIERDKVEVLCRVIDINPDFYGMVFCRTKREVEAVAQKLDGKGYPSDLLHGDLSQSLRERVLARFRQKKIRVLVVTDVASRGIDVQDMTHVINYALPQDSESYVHRVGRTGRAGSKGVAITFVTPSEFRKFWMIKCRVKSEIASIGIPDTKSLIEVKKKRLMAQLQEIAEAGVPEVFEQFAAELLASAGAESLLPGLLFIGFKSHLMDNYDDISPVKGRDGREDRRGGDERRGSGDRRDARKYGGYSSSRQGSASRPPRGEGYQGRSQGSGEGRSSGGESGSNSGEGRSSGGGYQGRSEGRFQGRRSSSSSPAPSSPSSSMSGTPRRSSSSQGESSGSSKPDISWSSSPASSLGPNRRSGFL